MPPTPLRDVKRRGISLTRSIDGGEVRVVKKRVRGVPLRWRPPRGPKVMLSVVLGRATRACVIHITGITCEGVVVSSDVFDSPARRRGGSFYLRDVAD